MVAHGGLIGMAIAETACVWPTRDLIEGPADRPVADYGAQGASTGWT